MGYLKHGIVEAGNSSDAIFDTSTTSMEIISDQFR